MHTGKHFNALHYCPILNSSTTNAQILLKAAKELRVKDDEFVNHNNYLDDKYDRRDIELPLSTVFRLRNKQYCELYLQYNARGNLNCLFSDIQDPQEYPKIQDILELFHFPTIGTSEINKALEYVRKTYATSEHLVPLHTMLLQFKESIKKEIAEATKPKPALIPAEPVTPEYVVSDGTDATEKTPLTTAPSNTTIDSSNEAPKKYTVVPADEEPTKNSGSSCNGWSCLLDLFTSKK